MAILSDKSIKKLAETKDMISPFESKQITRDNNGNKVLSYGLSSFGYDARLSNEFKIFTNINSSIVDPKNFDQDSFVERTNNVCIIPPNSFVLGRTIEYFKIPRNILGLCIGKSTYARCGIIVNVTPIEPECEGYIILEFSNTTTLPAKLYANEGICQFIFFEGDDICETSYADRQGKYMHQQGITLPKL
jgi:dCTP deaminase